MTKIITRLTMALCLTPAILGAATPPKEPHHWAKYDLDVPVGQSLTINNQITPGDAKDVAISKRENVITCQNIAAAGSCVTILTGIKNIVSYMASWIKDLSDQRNCGTFTSQVGNVKFRYYATGRNCDTTAEQATIAGAIKHHLESNGGQVCAMECLNLTHDGTWNGYLLVGPSDKFDVSTYCGPTLEFKQCTSGGKNDIN